MATFVSRSLRATFEVMEYPDPHPVRASRVVKVEELGALGVVTSNFATNSVGATDSSR